MLDGKNIGTIEIDEYITLELNLEEILKHANVGKKYIAPAKHPAAIEDIRVEILPHYTFHEIESEIKSTDERVVDVTLLDIYENKKTFRIKFQDRTKNLDSAELAKMREKIYKILRHNFKAKIG